MRLEDMSDEEMDKWVEKERNKFEIEFSHLDLSRYGSGYILAVPDAAWKGWLAAKKEAAEEMEPALQKFRAASRALRPEFVSILVEEGLEIVDTLYAKKGTE